MPLRRSLLTSVLFTAMACNRSVPPIQTETPPLTGGPVVSTKQGSAQHDGLRIAVEVPPGPHLAGDRIRIGLRFENTNDSPRRIFLLHPEIFRLFQSTFYLHTGANPTPIDVQPAPRPHGYMRTERDFPLLLPGAIWQSTQTLTLPASFQVGRARVRWEYKNDVERAAGGGQTLDGVMPPLFGGEQIPHIWLGTLTTEFEIQVEAAPVRTGAARLVTPTPAQAAATDQVLEALFRYQIRESTREPGEVLCFRVRTIVNGQEQIGDANEQLLERLRRDHSSVRPGSACGGARGERLRETQTGANAAVFDVGPIHWINETEVSVGGGASIGGWHIQENEYRLTREGGEWRVTSVRVVRMT